MKTTKNSMYEDIYALIADESPNIVVITDKHQKIEWVNKTFLTIWGYTKEEILGKNPNILQGEDTDQAAIKRMRQAIKANKPINEKVLNYTKKGHPYWVDIKIIPVLNKKGEAKKYISIANNIDAQISAEKQLKHSEEKLHAILDSTLDSHYLLDPELNIIEFNKVAATAIDKIWHKKLEVGNNIMEYLPKHYHRKFTRLFNMALVDDVTSQVEVNLRYNNSYSIWYSLVFCPAYNKHGTLLGVTLNATNIEKRKTAELKLIETNLKLAEIAQIQSHELRKPLANIMGLSAILQNRKPTNELKEIMTNMMRATNELDEVVHRIVNSTQVDDVLNN